MHQAEQQHAGPFRRADVEDFVEQLNQPEVSKRVLRGVQLRILEIMARHSDKLGEHQSISFDFARDFARFVRQAKGGVDYRMTNDRVFRGLLCSFLVFSEVHILLHLVINTTNLTQRIAVRQNCYKWHPQGLSSARRTNRQVV